MPRWLQRGFALLIVVLLVGGPLAYAQHRLARTRNFRVVREGVLYRSGQMRLDGLQQVLSDHRIKTVVTLRDADVPGQPPPDLEEERYCRSQEINYYRIPPRNWGAPGGPPPVEEGVRQFRAILADPANYPVLVHCFAGVHRTGAYCAIYRMEHEGWTNAQAIAEVKACGYGNLDGEWDILGYLERYRPVRPDAGAAQSASPR